MSDSGLPEALQRTPEQWAEGFCLISNSGCHPNHPEGQCRVCESRLSLGLPQDADGTLRQKGLPE